VSGPQAVRQALHDALGTEPPSDATVAARRRVCPWCKAQPLADCTVANSAGGRPVRMRALHPARYAGAPVRFTIPDRDATAPRGAPRLTPPPLPAVAEAPPAGPDDGVDPDWTPHDVIRFHPDDPGPDEPPWWDD